MYRFFFFMYRFLFTYFFFFLLHSHIFFKNLRFALNAIRKIDDHEFKVLLDLHFFDREQMLTVLVFCFICFLSICKKKSSHDFSFVLAKFYEMEDIIATTSVNTVTEEIFERQSLVKFIRDSLEFLLLVDEFIFQSVNLFLQFLYRSLSKFSTGLSLLQFGSQMFDLFFVMLFTLVGLLFRDLEGFEIVTDNSQLFFEFNDLGFTSVGPFLCTVEVGLNHLQFLGNVIVFFVCLLG